MEFWHDSAPQGLKIIHAKFAINMLIFNRLIIICATYAPKKCFPIHIGNEPHLNLLLTVA